MRRTRALPLAVLAGLTLLAGPATAGDDPQGVGAEGAPPEAAVTLGATRPPVVTPPRGPQGGTAPVGGPSAPDPYEYRTIFIPGPCPVRPDGALPRLVAEQRRLPPSGDWTTLRSYCDGDTPQPVVDLDDIRGTALTVVARVSPPRPVLEVQPQGGALVNQPAVFSVADPGPPPSDSALNPLSQRTVTVALAAPTYSWSFGDDAGRDVGGRRGQAYRRGSTVPAEGAGDPYVSHTYRGPGGRTVTVTASYAVSYTFSGDPRVFTLAPLVVSDSAPVQVRAAKSELVSR
ncbi:MAG: domain containing protein [Frankiales bacterium]|nr:domain containing protein [Frankiales bacterium]